MYTCVYTRVNGGVFMKDVKKLTYTALLVAFAIVIPITFSFARVTVGPFTATLASHVPMFLSMLIGPGAAVMVGLGSALGFLTAGPIVGARAFMHVFIGLIGAVLLNKNVSFKKVVLLTAPLHGILEALVVVGFISGGMVPKYSGSMIYYILMIVGLGTILHHFVDGTISYALAKSVSKATKSDFVKENI
jgi:niacin transporter